MNAMNNVFRTAENVVFNRVKENEVKNEGNFITVRNGKAVALMDGKEVPMPAVLYNEVGVEYFFISSFYEHAKKMAKKHGVYVARKQEPVRVWKNVKPGEPIQSVFDGFIEHEVDLDDTKVAAQNVVKGEFWGMPKEVLAEKYEFVRSEFDYDLYKPKANVKSSWVYSDVNVFGVLWGGFEFLTTPMINITKPDDCYGCNYIVWWGNDGRMGSYQVLGYFRACGKKFYDQPMAEPKSVLEATFQPPKELCC